MSKSYDKLLDYFGLTGFSNHMLSVKIEKFVSFQNKSTGTVIYYVFFRTLA